MIKIVKLISLLVLITYQQISEAKSAMTVLGGDFIFPNKIFGMPQKLSDIKDLQINSFKKK